MSSHSLTQALRNPRLVIVLQLGLCILLLGEVAKGAMGYTSIVVLILQVVGGITAIAALAVLAGLVPSPPERN